MKRRDWIISVSAGVLLGILVVVFQAIGYLPQILNVRAASDAENALTKTLQSYKTWSSLQGEAQLVQYDADNNPHLDIVSVQVSQPLKANVSFKSSDDVIKTNMKLVSDGKNIYQVDNGNLSYAQSNLPTSAHFAQDLGYLPQTLADVKKDEVYGHPFARLISNPMMDYIYPVSFPQARSGSTYQLLGEENIIGRATWKVELRTTTDYVIAWIDQATGIILKYSQEAGAQKIVDMEFVWIKIDQAIDTQAFSPPDKMKYHQTANP